MSSLMLDVTGVTESVLLQLRAMPDETAAIALDCRLRTLETQWKRTFVERGLILLEVEQRLLWKCLEDPETRQPYTSFERWILTAAPQSRSDAYAALRAVKELRDIPRERLEAIPRCNIGTLQLMSTGNRRASMSLSDGRTILVTDAAKELSERQFIREADKNFPEEHLEERRTLHMLKTANVSESASEIIRRGFKLVMENEHLTTKEQVLEFWASKSIQEYENGEDNLEVPYSSHG